MADDMRALIVEVDTLRAELRIELWAHLRPWCDDGDPRTCDRGALERLLERLCQRWADG